MASDIIASITSGCTCTSLIDIGFHACTLNVMLLEHMVPRIVANHTLAYSLFYFCFSSRRGMVRIEPGKSCLPIVDAYCVSDVHLIPCC